MKTTHSTLTAHQSIPCMVIRGGTSKGVYFQHKDLPQDKTERDTLLIRLMGSPDPKQIDGLGGATPITSKLAMISPSSEPGIDLDYEFAQIVVEKGTIDFPTCGNILSGVGVFAIETGLIPTQTPETVLTIRDVNTGGMIRQTLQTPEGRLTWKGETAIAGIPGTSAAVTMEFTNIVGGKTGAFYPSGNVTDILGGDAGDSIGGSVGGSVGGYECSLIDVAMPCVYFRASDFNLHGNESKLEIDTNKPLIEKLLALRILAGERMGLTDVAEKVYPKIVLVSPPPAGDNRGTIQARYLTPYQCHEAYAASGGFSLAAACLVNDGNIASQLQNKPANTPAGLTVIEHPSGLMNVEMTMENNDRTTLSGKVIRTARPIMHGQVYVP